MGGDGPNARVAHSLKRNLIYIVDEMWENLVNVARVWRTTYSFMELHGDTV